MSGRGSVQLCLSTDWSLLAVASVTYSSNWRGLARDIRIRSMARYSSAWYLQAWVSAATRSSVSVTLAQSQNLACVICSIALCLDEFGQKCVCLDSHVTKDEAELLKGRTTRFWTQERCARAVLRVLRDPCVVEDGSRCTSDRRRRQIPRLP